MRLKLFISIIITGCDVSLQVSENIYLRGFAEHCQIDKRHLCTSVGDIAWESYYSRRSPWLGIETNFSRPSIPTVDGEVSVHFICVYSGRFCDR